jgi:4'-phosphopantetheinyl transferase
MNGPVLATRTGSPPALVRGVCHVWWTGPDDVGPAHDALLSPADLQRRRRLRLEGDRRRLTAAAAVVRAVVGTHTGMPPAAVWIDRTCPGCGQQHGKPRLPALADVHLSVSHSAGNVVVAVGRDGPVGVDVEQVGRFGAAELESLAAATLAPEEWAEVARLPDADRARAFTTYWTRKEALLKATGDGIATLLHRVVVSPPSAPPRVLRWPGGDVPVSLHPLHPRDTAVATLALLTRTPVRVVEHPAGPLLSAALLQGPAADVLQTRRRLSTSTTRSQR